MGYAISEELKALELKLTKEITGIIKWLL